MSFKERNFGQRLSRSQSNLEVGDSSDQYRMKKRYSDFLEDALRTEMNLGSTGDDSLNHFIKDEIHIFFIQSELSSYTEYHALSLWKSVQRAAQRTLYDKELGRKTETPKGTCMSVQNVHHLMCLIGMHNGSTTTK